MFLIITSSDGDVQKEVLLSSNASNQVLLRETIGFDSLISILKLRGTTYSFTQQKAKEEYKDASEVTWE
ncbi:golgin candidate 6 isoform X1 [Tanacetum coccineum]